MIGRHEREALALAVAVVYGGTASPAWSELKKRAVAPPPWWSPSSPPWPHRKCEPGEEAPPTSAHIIGRPNDNLLDIMLGHGADPEETFIRGSEPGLLLFG